MTTNQESLFRFEADLTAFAKKVDLDLGTVVRRVVIDLFTRIVQRTPVDTGRARSSWDIQHDSPGEGVPSTQLTRLSEQEATDRAKQALTKLIATRGKEYAVWWIFNNLPYILPLEYGHSQKAPAGMVRVSLSEVEVEIERFLQ